MPKGHYQHYPHSILHKEKISSSLSSYWSKQPKKLRSARMRALALLKHSKMTREEKQEQLKKMLAGKNLLKP